MLAHVSMVHAPLGRAMMVREQRVVHGGRQWAMQSAALMSTGGYGRINTCILILYIFNIGLLMQW